MNPPIVSGLPRFLEPVTRDPFLDGLRGPVNLAFLFCDLKDFTEYADREGDEAAVAAINRLAAVVSAERGERCGSQKSLGDGVMLTYEDPGEAVAGGARIIARMRATDGMPHVHSSVHAGVAIAEHGDYIGSTVKIAARLLDAAGRDELVATRPVVDACSDRFAWDEPWLVSVRGLRDPIEVSRLASDRRSPSRTKQVRRRISVRNPPSCDAMPAVGQPPPSERPVRGGRHGPNL